MLPRGLIVANGAHADWGNCSVELLPVANRPVLVHALEALRSAGVDEVIVVTSTRNAAPLRAVLGGSDRGWAVRLAEVEQDAPLSAADALAAAQPMLGDHPVLAHEGGALSVAPLRPLWDRFSAEGADAVVAHPDGAACLLGQAAVEALRAAVSDAAELPQLAAGLARRELAVERHALGPFWRPADGPEALLEANRRVLDGLQGAGTLPSPPGCRISGRVQIHPTASVERATVCGPAVVGAHAQLLGAYIGPYTSIGDGAVVEGTEIEDSIVLPRASIRYVGERVRGSLIGRGARLERSLALPRTLCVRIDAEADVTLP